MVLRKGVSKGMLEGAGALVAIFLAKKIDKSLFSPIAIKSSLVIMVAVMLSSLGVDYLDEKGYFSP